MFLEQVHAFDVLGDPVRRRIVELLGDGARPAGAVVTVIADEFGITQPAVSRHLRVLRESGFARMEVDGNRRIYALDRAGFDAADAVLQRYRAFWAQHLDALETEVARGRRPGRGTS